jgi:two-component system, OmpR family, phosphate regulon sensor histidine kinase PhoR
MIRAMWPLLAIVLVASLIASYVFWRRGSRLEAQLAQAHQSTEALREQCQQAVTREQTQQEALFNSMTEGILVLDPNARVRLSNQATKQLFGLSGDLQGRTIMEAFRRHELQDLIARAGGQESEAGIELEVPGPPPRMLRAAATMVRDRQGGSQGTIVVFHDLTRLKQLENLRQDFVANVSHELRTPLSMIKGCVETLLDGAKNDPAAANRFLEIIQRHTHRLSFLIEDLLVLAQLESGRIEFDFQPVAIQELAESVMNDLRARAAERNIVLQNLIPPELRAKADAERLQQVFYNLVENAIKYGRPAGRVQTGAKLAADAALPAPATSATPSAATAKGPMLEIWVGDDGPGLPPEAKDRVFERFYRVDRARSREQGGTGLGLAIVKHIVQAHDGTVWVTSEPGKGATFYFTLPAADQA